MKKAIDCGVMVSIYLPSKLLTKVERLAEEKGVSRNTVFRELLQNALSARQPQSGRVESDQNEPGD